MGNMTEKTLQNPAVETAGNARQNLPAEVGLPIGGPCQIGLRFMYFFGGNRYFSRRFTYFFGKNTYIREGNTYFSRRNT